MTQGPYEDDDGMAGDDPAAYLAQEAREAPAAEEIPSTVEPEVTERPVHVGGMLATPEN